MFGSYFPGAETTAWDRTPVWLPESRKRLVDEHHRAPRKLAARAQRTGPAQFSIGANVGTSIHLGQVGNGPAVRTGAAPRRTYAPSPGTSLFPSTLSWPSTHRRFGSMRPRRPSLSVQGWHD